MKAILPLGAALLAAGIVLLMIEAIQPEYVDASGWLIEPFAYRVGGAGLTVLGVALLAWRSLVRACS